MTQTRNDIRTQIVNKLFHMLVEAGFNMKSETQPYIDVIADALANCTIMRKGETSIVREAGKDGETDFIMTGTTAWITVANPTNPTETGLVLINANDEGVTTEIWPGNGAEGEDTLCYSFWGDLNPEQEPA